MEYVLNLEGHQVTSVARLSTACALLDAQPFDLVVTDLNLPDGDGLEVADRASEHGVRVLLVTGYSPSEADPFALARHDFVLKPVHPAPLIRAIRRSLAR